MNSLITHLSPEIESTRARNRHPSPERLDIYPCKYCYLFDHCKRELVACEGFRTYVSTGLRLYPEGAPTRDHFVYLFPQLKEKGDDR